VSFYVLPIALIQFLMDNHPIWARRLPGYLRIKPLRNSSIIIKPAASAYGIYIPVTVIEAAISMNAFESWLGPHIGFVWKREFRRVLTERNTLYDHIVGIHFLAHFLKSRALSHYLSTPSC